MRLFYYFVFISIFITSCTSETPVAQSTPEEAVKEFFNALKNSDFEKARLLGTSSTKESLLNFETNIKMVSDDEKKTLMAPFQIELSKVTCADVHGAMNCTLCCSTDGDIIIEMIEQDKKWFAQVDFAF